MLWSLVALSAKKHNVAGQCGAQRRRLYVVIKPPGKRLPRGAVLLFYPRRDMLVVAGTGNPL
jgi:hypothetical protein